MPLASLRAVLEGMQSSASGDVESGTVFSNYGNLKVWHTLMKFAGGKNGGVLQSMNQIISELKPK